MLLSATKAARQQKEEELSASLLSGDPSGRDASARINSSFAMLAKLVSGLGQQTQDDMRRVQEALLRKTAALKTEKDGGGQDGGITIRFADTPLASAVLSSVSDDVLLASVSDAFKPQEAAEGFEQEGAASGGGRGCGGRQQLERQLIQ